MEHGSRLVRSRAAARLRPLRGLVAFVGAHEEQNGSHAEGKREGPWRGRIGVWQKSRILVGLGLWLGYDWGLQKPSGVRLANLTKPHETCGALGVGKPAQL